MPKRKSDPNEVVAELRALARERGWVLARWSLKTPEYHDATVLKRVFTAKQRAAILYPRYCSNRVASRLIRRGILTEQHKLTPKGKELQIRLKRARIYD